VAEGEAGIVGDGRLPDVAHVVGEEQQRSNRGVVAVDACRTGSGHGVAALVCSHLLLLSMSRE